MDINDILNNLGLDLTNPEVKRGALEAIEAILDSRNPVGSSGGGPNNGNNAEEVELDPDLLQPSIKHHSNALDDDIEIEDEEHLLDQIKHNDSEDDFNDEVTSENSPLDNQSPDTENSSDSSETELSNEEETPIDASTTDVEEVEDTDTEVPTDTSTQADTAEDSEKETLEDEHADGDIDEEDLLDDTLKGAYEDTAIQAKQNARKIKRERTLQAAKKALANAQAKKVAPALIRELENSIAALEELTEAVKKSLKDISDEEFNLLINRVFDAIGAVGDTSLTFTSEEEREIRAQEIKNDLSSTSTQNELSAEDIAQIRAEHQAIKARDQETNKYKRRARGSFKGFQDFLNSLYRAIALQVSTEETNDDTWSAINRRNRGSGVLQPGKRINELPNKKIPVIDFYFDQSGSWDESDIEVGKKAVSKLADMEADGQIKINIYYFSNNVFTDANSARAQGGTRAWNEIVKNIIATQATNVVIMTDADMESWWSGDKALSYTVPGYVWYLWRDGENAPRLPRDLKGRGGTQQFSFSQGDL